MTLSDKEIQEYKERVLKVARLFIAFCDKFNLRYFGIAGTAIGAIRHSGFIPWDDDMDFVMPRPDYEQMILLKQELDDDIELLTYHDNPYYASQYAKICDKHSSLIIDPRIRCMMGAFIDVFPMDGLPSDSIEINHAYFNKYQKIKEKAEAINKYYFAFDYLRSLKRLDFRDIVNHFRSDYYHLFNKSNPWFTIGDKYLLQHSFDDSKYVAYFGTHYGPRVISPQKWFTSSIELPFEGIYIKFPVGIDNYLRHVYGDYMKLPPENKRTTRHSYVYLNMSERKEFEGVVSRF